MCLLKNGVGVVLSNGEKTIMINGMLINQNVCVKIDSYNGYINKANHNLDIIKVYKHLSDKWNNGYMYGLLDKMEESELLFDYDRYIVKVIDFSSCYYIGDNEIICSSLHEAEEKYERVVKHATETLIEKGWLDCKTPIFKSDQLNFKATMFGNSETDIEREDVIFPIKIIMKKF